MIDTLIICNYLCGSALVVFLGYKRRISFLLCWPYIPYGFGLLVPVLFPDNPRYNFAPKILEDQALLYAAAACTATLCMFIVLDYLMLRRKTFRSLLSDYTYFRSITELVQGPGFIMVVLLTVVIYVVLFIAAFQAGDIGGEYTFKGIERLTFFGPLGMATEAVSFLAILYGAAHILARGKMRRIYVVEAILLACLIARAVVGTRIFLFKVAVVLMILVALTVRVRLKQIALISVSACVLYAAGVYIGANRAGLTVELTPAALMDPINAETYFPNLSLLIATRNIQAKIYQPLLPIATLAFVIPSWSMDKVTLINELYDREWYAKAVGFETVSPVGAVHFLADALIAYGPYFLLPVAVTCVLVLVAFRGTWRQTHCVLFVIVLAVSYELWRDSFMQAFKIAFEVYALECGVLWLVSRRQKRPVRWPARQPNVYYSRPAVRPRW